MKKIIVLVDGLWASGKTTLARELSTSLSAPLFSFDSYREEFFDSPDHNLEKDSFAFEKICCERLFKDIEVNLKNQPMLVVEAQFSEDLFLLSFERLKKIYDCDFVTVHLYADHRVRLWRALKRLVSGKRHEAHIGKNAVVRKLIGILLPKKFYPGDFDKTPMNLGKVIRLDATKIDPERTRKIKEEVLNI